MAKKGKKGGPVYSGKKAGKNAGYDQSGLSGYAVKDIKRGGKGGKAGL